MKLVVKKSELAIEEDPRNIRDPVAWKRLELMIFDEACSDTWGCAFYRFLRKHRLGVEERTAGNRYIQVVMDHRRLQATDPDELPEVQRDLAYRRIARIKKLYNEIRQNVIGFGRRVLDPLMFDETWPTSEKEHIIIKLCLANLKNFFGTGTKPAQNP